MDMRLGAIGFLTGIFCFQQFSELPDIRWGYLLLLMIPLALFVPKLRFICLLTSGFLWTLLYTSQILSTGIPVELEGQDLQVEGAISSIPEKGQRSVRFYMDVDTIRYKGVLLEASDDMPGHILLSWYGYVEKLEAGDRWRLGVRLKRPHGFMNPGGFDYEGWLFQQHIRATGYVKPKADNQKFDNDSNKYLLARGRQHLKEKITAALDNNAFTGIITALAIGERQDISEHQWDVFTRTATNHLIAISGLHIGLVAAFIFFTVRWGWLRLTTLALRIPAAKIAAVLALCGAFIYAAMAGFSIPTQRALIMVAVVMSGVWLQRHRAPGHTLALALLVVLIVDPLSVMSAGFWLSFCAVAVILIGMNSRIRPAGKWWKWGRVHVLVALGLLPLMLILFQRVPLLSPLANFVAVPWVSILVVPFVLIGTVLLEFFPLTGTLFLKLAAVMLSVLWPVLDGLSELEYAQWIQHNPVTWTAVPAIIGTLLLIAPRGIPGRWIGIFWLMPVIIFMPSRPVDGDVWFTLLDVGQGLSAVVQTRDHVLVYDTGARFSDSFDAGSAVVAPYLRYHGIDEIDTLIIGHGDNDHIGGAESLHEEINIKKLISSVPDKIHWMGAQSCVQGQSWHWNQVEFHMLHPAADEMIKDNNASCVLRISNQAGSILLPGDIEKRAERELLGNQRAYLASDILVAPHHGSKTSSTQAFIDAVQPQTVLFPVGYRNRYRFPKKEIVERYQSSGINHMFDTSKHGAITLKLGHDGVIHGPVTHRQSHRHYWNAE